MMRKRKNTGKKLEREVYDLISKIVNENEFIVSNPNVKIKKKPRYYSKDRDSEIEFDISVEKYLAETDKNKNIKPSIIVVIECKDYKNGIPVDDVEEFHAKLQQIGADNTKGIIITKHGCFQRSALAYAESKGTALARIIPENQIEYLVFYDYGCYCYKNPLLEIDSMSKNRFFSSYGDNDLMSLVFRLFEIDYFDYCKKNKERRKDNSR